MNHEVPSRSMWGSIRSLIVASWQATSGDRLRFFTFVFLYVTAYSTELLVPWVTGWALAVFVQEGLTSSAFDKSVWYIEAFIGLKVIYALLHHYARYLQAITAFKARFRKLEEIFSTLVNFPLKWHVHHHSGENISQLNRSVGAVDSVIGNYIWQIIDGGIKFVIASLAIFTLDYLVALSVLVMGIATVLLMLLFNRRLTQNIRRNNRYNDRLNRTCIDYLSNIITVKTLRLEEPAVRYLTNQRENGLALCRKITKYQELKWGSIGLGYSFVIGSSLFIYFYNRVNSGGAFDVARVYVLLDYLNRVFSAITAFTGYYSGIIEAATAYDDAHDMLKEYKNLGATGRPSRMPVSWVNLQLRDVEFSYTGESLHLKGLNIDIRKGEKIALVGPSGGGKSTLLKVMGGMLQVSRAGVYVHEAPPLDMDDVAGVSLLIPQEPEIFSETIRYNLSLGQKFEQSELDHAVKLCRIDYILDKVPNGWDSDLEEAGLNISVGERQRIALARGILRIKNKDILLLDEPTSSLDPITEKEIFKGILGQFSNRTIMMACHRLALVPLFDRVIYVKDGRIEEDGSFNDLIAANGLFAHAWSDYERHVVTHESAVTI